MEQTPTRGPAASRPFVWHMLGLAVIGIVILLTPRPALADHPELLSSEPTSGASLEGPPPDVTLTFNALLVEAESSLTVVDAGGAVVSDGPSQLVPTNHKMIRVMLRPDLGPGDYAVTWSIVSAESGGESKGSVSFTVAPRADAPVDSPPLAEDSAPQGAP